MRRGNMTAERTRHGLTIKDVSTATGISVSAIGDWESGRRSPNSEGLMKLSTFYDCSPDYLMQGIGSKVDFIKAAQERMTERLAKVG